MKTRWGVSEPGINCGCNVVENGVRITCSRVEENPCFHMKGEALGSQIRGTNVGCLATVSATQVICFRMEECVAVLHDAKRRVGAWDTNESHQLQNVIPKSSGVIRAYD